MGRKVGRKAVKKHGKGSGTVTYARFPSDLLEAIDALRSQNGLDLTRSAVIRQLVREALGKRETETV